MNKPIPFNLELFKSGRKAVTRGGLVVPFAYHCPLAGPLHRVGYVSVTGDVISVSETGMFRSEDPSSADLVSMASVCRTAWVLMHMDPGDRRRLVSPALYATESDAKRAIAAGHPSADAVEISWEE